MTVSSNFVRCAGILAGILVLAACGGGGDDGGGSTVSPPAEPARLVFVANSDSSDNSISIYALDATTGALSPHPSSPYRDALGSNPSSVAVAPSGRFAYVTNPGTSDVSALAVNPGTNAITLVANTPYPVASTPQHVAVDPLGRFAYVALSSNAVAAFTINLTTGALTEIVGGAGQAPGTTNPRHLAFDPAGRFLFVANRGSANITSYSIAQNGTLTLPQVAPVSFTTPTPPLPNAIAVHPLGRFVFVANSGNDTLSAFELDSSTGALTEIPGSPFGAPGGPHAVALEPSGRFAYVANLTSSTLTIFEIDATSGAPGPIATLTLTAISNPQSLVVDPSGKFLYVTLSSRNEVAAFRIDSATGALAQVQGSPYQTGSVPLGVIATGPIQ